MHIISILLHGFVPSPPQYEYRKNLPQNSTLSPHPYFPTSLIA